MKRIAIADIHLTGFEEDPIDNNNLPMRLGQIVKSLNYVIKKSKELKINQIDILGDIIHDKSVIFAVAQDAFKEILLQNQDINFLIMAGNHDFSHSGDIQRSAISVFKGYKNVKCVDKDFLIDNNITILPFTNNFLSKIKNLKENDILLIHLGLNEAHLQSGLSKVDKIKLSDLKKFKLVISGHYHAPQNLENENTKMWYVGGFTNHSWNDKNEQKRFLIYDTENLQVDSYPIEGQIQYKEYVIDNLSNAKEILEQAEKDKNQGHYVRIRKLIKEEIENTPHDILVIENKSDDNITNRGITVTMNLKEKLLKYLSIKEIKDDKHEQYINILQKHNIV